MHPTILHRERKPDNAADASMACGLTGAGASSLLSVVPVTVYSPDSGRQVNTYALLDSKSTAVFCTKSLQYRLSATGAKTRIRVQTINGTKCIDTNKIANLIVSDIGGENRIELPDTYIQDTIPVTKDDIITGKDALKAWPYLQEINIPEMKPNEKVELLIGNNVPKAMEPTRVIQAQDNGPFACKTQLGWEVHGLTTQTDKVSVHRIKVEENIQQQLIDLYNQDCTERSVDDTPQRSRDDRRFLDIVQTSINHTKGHYEMLLPLRDKQMIFPNNRVMAANRLEHLKRRFQKDAQFKAEYVKAMNETIENGYAEAVPNDDTHTDGRRWFIPHHGVRHPKKLKIRVVFDCAATFRGTSLNKQLLQGPDMTNSLVGVLLRFRQEQVAVMADVQGMFNQVKVSEECRDLLRFLWWPNGDTSKAMKEYRMTTHLFGAVSSPACSNYALRRTAIDNTCSKPVTETINRNFYVDDCLKSLTSDEEAITLVEDLTSVLSKGGFKLTKWVSNSSQVMKVIPEEERASGTKSLDLHEQGNTPPERALGVLWSPETDKFSFKIEVKDHNMTRRGILSTVSSLYDPLGLVAPAILPARLLLQDLCKLQLSWDDEIPQEYQRQWKDWISELPKLENFSIARCFKPTGFESPKTTQLHHFADASTVGYGAVSYLRMVNSSDEVHSQLLMSKSRVAPLKRVTIPRMELTAATVAVRMDNMLRKELELPIDQSVFWTDSTTVLGYISSEASRFQTFVANRVELIREATDPSQWHYVKSESNPADECSRGLKVQKFLDNTRWINGPEFLQEPEDKWPEMPRQRSIDIDDPEVKKLVISHATVIKDSAIDKLLTYYSSWYRLRRAVAWILRIKKHLRYKVRQKKSEHVSTTLQQSGEDHTDKDDDKYGSQVRGTKPLNAKDIQDAETAVVKYEQSKAFPEEIKILERQSLDPASENGKLDNSHVQRSSSIKKLCPFLLKGVLRVGGRLSKAALPENTRYPMILPKSSPVTELILREIHEMTGHSGRNYMLHILRKKFWIVNANSCTRKIVNKCVSCRKYSRKAEVQRMADLPKDRVTPDQPPFTNVGMDFFGPFYVRVGRSSVKRYGTIFTCLTTRAVHIEKAESMDTSACINAIRRFIARRGQVKSIRSDNGTNMVGAENELRQEIQKLNQALIHSTLLQKSINWIFNPPAASHHGGVWERMIRSIRKVLNSVLQEQVLTDDNLHTLFCEVEGILNSRPITRSSDDIDDLEALTPNHLLLLKDNLSGPQPLRRY
ncbi:uncharacterized protein [Amphiura filiformis]|uniref:uncharacterized protein n=1 Tax=Amphiura filiformis TaxID=82378 RepID=UPI003B212FCC